MRSSVLNELNPQQQQAVLQTDGPLLVVAGAGSGKTRVLTAKIAYLIEEKGVYPSSILAITFTNKAASEMKTRVQDTLGIDVDPLWMGTFHSICARILRRNIEHMGYTSNFTIYDRDDQKSLIKEILKEFGTTEKEVSIASLLSMISKAKGDRMNPDAFYKTYVNYPLGRLTAEVYESYVRKLKAYNALDFDDLINHTLTLFDETPEVLAYYQRKFKYVFVDEYQDTNRTQYELIRHFSGFHHNICVVGDGDQSIYGWRGAHIGNILDFEKDFPGAEVVKLEQNYRSTKNILNAANVLIANNEERKDKNLWTDKEEGKPVLYREAFSENGESQMVMEWIQHCQYDGYKLKDMAILYRTNAQSREFEEIFMREGVPYRVVGGLKFYDRKEIKDIIAYMKVLVNPTDNIAFKRIINTPKRGIGATSLEKLERLAQAKETSMYAAIADPELAQVVSKKIHASLLAFRKTMEGIKEDMDATSISETVERLMIDSGYLKYLKETPTIENQSRIENMDAFLGATSSYEEQVEEATLETYLHSVSLMSDVDKATDAANSIDLMTVHSAKGLEYPVVFVTGLEEGLLPSSRTLEEGNLEEERRLLYVAITRGEERVYLSSTTYRRSYGRPMIAKRSRFIGELGNAIEEVVQKRREEEVLEFGRGSAHSEMKQKLREAVLERKKKEASQEGVHYQLGDKIIHKSWGEGTVVQVVEKDDGAELVIAFSNKGLKRLNQSLAPIKKVTT